MNKRCFAICLLPLLLINIASAQQLEKITLAGSDYIGSSPYGFTVMGDKLFFAATDSSNRVGLYVTTGTDATATRVTPANTIGSLNYFTVFKGRLFFTCDDGVHGRELWESNGTVEGTKLYADIYAGSESSSPGGLTATDNMLFFLARNSSLGTKTFSCDGAPGGVYMIRSQQSYFFDFLGRFAVLNNEVFFKGGNGPGLWKSDGTIQGTVMINANITPMGPGGKVGVLNDKLYFAGSDLVNSAELWATDGTSQGTYLVKNIYPDQANIKYGSLPNGYTVFNNSLYFSANDGTHGEELFVTDGTEQGTHLVKDFTPGAVGSRPSQMTAVNDTLYISCLDAKQLWKSNGQEGGTSLVASTNDRWYGGALLNDEIYYLPGTLGGYLYKTGGTAATTGFATAENAFYPIYNYNIDNYLTVFKGGLYFCGNSTGVSDYREPLRLVADVVTHTYTFTGGGYWSNPANWAGSNAPPSTLLQGDIVLINEDCVLDIPVQAEAGSTITVAAGKNLLVQGALTIQ